MKQGKPPLFKALLTALFVPLIGPFLFSQSTPPPDLDLAYKSAAQFWNLVAQKKRSDASRFLASDEQRSAFLAWSEPPYLNPTITNLRFGSDSGRVVIAVSVQTMGANGQTATRKLEQEWTYQGKRWLLDLDISESRLFSGKPLPTDDDKLIQQFKAAFRIKTMEIEVPPDAFGKTLEAAIEYEYAGPSDMVLEYVSGPEFISVEIADLRRLQPQGKIRFIIVGRQLLSNENISPLKLQVQSGLSRQEFVIPVKWLGHAPYRWTFSPAIIEPQYLGEVKLEILNQSEKVWRPSVASVSLASWEMTGWAPQADVHPGESVIYSFKVAPGDRPETNSQGGSVTVYLDGPQGTLTIALPYSKPVKPATAPAPPSREELERLLRGVPANPPAGPPQ